METVFSSFDSISDECLCRLAASGDSNAEEILVERYGRLVRICARPFFLAGGDSEDLIQEGMMGLLSAIRGFDVQREANFHTYAEVCIKRRLLTAIKAATRDKHTPLNNYVSFETPLFGGNSDQYTYGTAHRQLDNPENLLIDREEVVERMDALKGMLSSFEGKVLGLYLDGLSYVQIANEVCKSPKSVDNAVQRIRRKLAQHL